MDLFLLVDLILYFLIISHSYRLICKDQINRKELFFFGAYTLLTEIVLDFPFYLLYIRWVRDCNIFISFGPIFLFSMDETV
ncbi:sensor histidine kinase [Streptococcus pneumoniae]|nr:sensor histidine kinase [Streptococcus pneumoniae]